MKTIIFLTGAAGSGKDTLANSINEIMRFPHIKLADPLVDMMKSMFNVDDEYIEKIQHDRSLKEKPSDLFLGKSYRECMIWLAEECIKPKFGRDFFIKHLLNRVDQKRFKDVFVVSDLGFKEDELSHIDPNKYKVYIVKINRDSVDKSVKDSRKVIENNIYTTIENNGDLNSFLSEGRKLFNQIYQEVLNDRKKTKEV